jgi:hypothetical protein
MAVDGKVRSGTGPQRLRKHCELVPLRRSLRGREERHQECNLIFSLGNVGGGSMIAVRASPLAASFAR